MHEETAQSKNKLIKQSTKVRVLVLVYSSFALKNMEKLEIIRSLTNVPERQNANKIK